MRTAFALAFALSGCSSEYGVSSLEAQQPADGASSSHAVVPQIPTRAGGEEPRKVHFQRVDVSHGPTSAISAREDAVAGVREETYDAGGGATTAVADYLFVVDNSTSMNRVLENVQRGMLTLAADGAFPSKARIAVMTSLPSEVGDPGMPHQTAVFTPGLEHDPGFGQLVDRQTIATYRELAPPKVAAHFPLDGCDAWFAPGDVNSAGQPCLIAHTQIGMTAVGVEAGLVAFRQLVERAEAPLFRPGAAVNVIFVSDTHDPGLPLDEPGVDELVALRPDFAQLQELVSANSLVSSFRVHAIAPARPCVEKWSDGPTYRTATHDAGGVFLDMCTATDYRPLISKIAKRGSVVQQPVFPLGRKASEVDAVTVDGQPVGFSVSADGGVLVLDQALPSRRARVGVRYHYQR